VIIGAGIYGLYAGLTCAKNGQNILILEQDKDIMQRASSINQARVHMGYHYPRSLSTALKSANYFDRFNKDFSFCINGSYDKIYAIASKFSWSSPNDFKYFCKNADIPCEEVSIDKYFKQNSCDAAFMTKEYSYDANILKAYVLQEIDKLPNINIRFNQDNLSITKLENTYNISTSSIDKIYTKYILNATYASINQILHKANLERFKIKYELCEIILCKVSDSLKNAGITLMDGPFFSVMPYGKSNLHSLTAVSYTPQLTSYDELPTFSCQSKTNGSCTNKQLDNCNTCIAKPQTSWIHMHKLAQKYLHQDIKITYQKSLFAIKSILKKSEIDDSRPTLIKHNHQEPNFVSVLSGKINTIYDLDQYLLNDV